MASEAGTMPDVSGYYAAEIVARLEAARAEQKRVAQERDNAMAEVERLTDATVLVRCEHPETDTLVAELERSEAACASAMAEVEALKADVHLLETNLRRAHKTLEERNKVVEAAKAVRELWRYDAMGAAEPEIHVFVAAVDALSTKDGA